MPARSDGDSRPESTTIDGLLPRVARGDAAAFADVCDQVAGAVYALVHRIIGDQSQAEQAAAEVLVEVWRSATRFRAAEGSGLSWIMTMARRRAVDLARTPAGPNTAAGPGTSAADDMGGSELAHPGLAALPERQREAMLMALWGYNRRQVAALTGVPTGTAAEWLRDGLLGLTSHLE